jgi:N-acetylglucosamine repressor
MPPRNQILDLERIAILGEIRAHGPVSRAHLARSLRLRPSSVTEFVRELISEAVIEEIGQGGSNGGRPPVLLSINRVGNFAVGVTVEPRGISAGLVRWDGAILRHAYRAVSASSGPTDLQVASLDAVDEVLAASGVPLDRVRGVGIGVSALVDPATNEAVFSSTFSAARSFRLDGLAERLGKPIYLEDIAYLMALGERWFVYPNEERPLVFMAVASGTCGAVIEPWAAPGSPRFAAEFGHMVVDRGGPLCGCGKRGCLEALVSEPAILATANRLLATHAEVPITLRDIANLARAGNAIAERIIAAAAEYLEVAVANLANVFAPALIVLGGSVVDAWGDLLMSRIHDHLAHHLMEYLQPRVTFVASRMGPDLPLLGGAARVMQACFASPREAAAVLPLMDRHMGLVADWASGTPVGDAAGG